jgi:hypothetical protein
MEVSGQLHAPVSLPPGKEPPGTHWIGGWVGPRSGLEAGVIYVMYEGKSKSTGSFKKSTFIVNIQKRN